MNKKFKVLRDGIKQRDGEKKKDDLIELSPSAAQYFLNTDPPYVSDLLAKSVKKDRVFSGGGKARPVSKLDVKPIVTPATKEGASE